MIRRETIISTNATIDWIIIPFQLPDERPGPGWPVVALAHGRGSMPAREKVYQQGVIWWYRFLQGFQIFKSATLLKSASLVARFISPFRLIIARWAESIANKRYCTFQVFRSDRHLYKSDFFLTYSIYVGICLILILNS